MYNQYNVEPNNFDTVISSFKNFLHAEKISNGSIRSYLSDVRHFLGWLTFFLESNKIETRNVSGKWEMGREVRMRSEGNEKTHPYFSFPDSPLTSQPHFLSLLKHVNQKVLDAYKLFQTNNNIPLKTINRRFSSLRRFGIFCKFQNWVSSNPFDTLKNIPPNQPFSEDKCHLVEFKIELWKKGASKLTIKNYLNDIKQFLGWLDLQKR